MSENEIKTCWCGKECQGEKGLKQHQTMAHGGDQKEAIETKPENKISSTILSPEEKGIADRVSNQDTEWFNITEDELEDFSLQANPLDLHNYPEAFKLEREKQYAFRWCERTSRRIDELTRSVAPPLRWALVTRSTLPVMEKYIDPVLGCVPNLDQALLFKPYAHHKKVLEAKRGMADAKARSSGINAVAARRNSDKIKTGTGKEFEINSRDEVQYQDSRNDVGDLVIEE